MLYGFHLTSLGKVLQKSSEGVIRTNKIVTADDIQVDVTNSMQVPLNSNSGP